MQALTAAKPLASDLSYSGRKLLYTCVILFCIILPSIPLASFSQKLEFSYSYFNLTRNNGGGTLQQGDTIEIHALAKVNATSWNFYYIDTMQTGTQYVPGSMQLITNEGVLFGAALIPIPIMMMRACYSVTGDQIRINIGSGISWGQRGVSFYIVTGGGTVTAGSVPKFYGSTLFVVSYKLLITANNGDTIHPTGTYYFDTTSSKKTHTKSYHFTYPGIKVIQNQALCNNFSSATFTAESSFGSGTVQNRAAPAIVPGYTKVNLTETIRRITIIQL